MSLRVDVVEQEIKNAVDIKSKNLISNLIYFTLN